jgi:hypothetical protein
MQPTFKQVPPREPRFSIQATCSIYQRVFFASMGLLAHLHAGLSSLDSCDITRDTATDNDEIFLLCLAISSSSYLNLCNNATHQPLRRILVVTGSGSRCWMRRMCSW